MTRAEELRGLAERVEALSGPDRATDDAIYQAATGKIWNDKDYTASLDAAMSLVPEVPDGRTISLNIDRDAQTEATIEIMWDTYCGYAATPALALCAAALRALAEQQP